MRWFLIFVFVPALLSAQAAPTLRAMAACCAGMSGPCGRANSESSRDCCQQRVAAPAALGVSLSRPESAPPEAAVAITLGLNAVALPAPPSLSARPLAPPLSPPPLPASALISTLRI